MPFQQTLGIKLAKPEVRPIILVGDGAFQMSSSELGTILQNKINPLVVVLNNKGYTTERIIIEGSFNNIVNWNYHKFTDLIGGGNGYLVETEEELEKAVNDWVKTNVFTLLNCVLDSMDASSVLKRMAISLSKKTK